MPKHIVCTVLLLLLFGSWTPLLAQGSPPVSCTAQAGGTPSIRAEGITELVGDVIINCTGGTPTAPGQPLPQVNVQVFTSPSINITSRLLGDGLSEALLFVDEPAPQDQLLCPPPGETPAPNCNPIAGTYNGNAFQARQAGANSLIWHGVPFGPPGTVAQRIIRITNVRVNASQLGQGASRDTTNISIVSFITAGPGGPPINFPVAPIPVGVIQPSTIFSVLPQSYRHCEPQNPTLLGGGQSVATQNFATLRYGELFPTVFLRRNAAIPNSPDGPPPDPIPQDVLGTGYGTESGYYNPNVTGSAAGLADHGTRLMAQFNNVPSGVQIWVETGPPLRADGAATGTARLIDTDRLGAALFRPIFATGQLKDRPIARIPIQSGSGRAVWEIVNSDSDKVESLEIPLIVAFNANGTFAGSPAEGTITVNMNMGPLSPFGSVLNTATLSIPRFHQAPEPLPAAANEFGLVTLHSCSGASPQLNLGGVFQGATDPGVLALHQQDGGLLRSVNIPVVSPNGRVSNVTATPSTETLAQLSADNPAIRTNWLEATITPGTTPATVTARVHPEGLAPGEYLGRVDISSAQAGGAPLRVRFTLRVSPQGPFFLAGTVNHAASYAAGFLSPGAATTIFGLRFGPPQIAFPTFGPNGQRLTAAGETRVLIDGVAAPMIFARGGPLSQLSFFAPYSLAGKTAANVRVEYQGVLSNSITLPVIDVAPGLFTLNSQGFGQGAVLNQDLSVNGPNNPARPGQVIVLYGSGYGQSNPAGTDGMQAAAPLPEPLQPMSVLIGGKQGIIKYQGPGPGLDGRHLPDQCGDPGRCHAGKPSAGAGEAGITHQPAGRDGSDSVTAAIQ